MRGEGRNLSGWPLSRASEAGTPMNAQTLADDGDASVEQWVPMLSGG